MPLTSGTNLAHYEILEPIGKGGQGEVYRGQDTKLGRYVAIKVLPDEFVQNSERLARFEREARVLAALNHPNIAAIYGTEDQSLVLEFVEGPTLADRLASGPLPVDEAIEIARQVAEALEAAHEAGVIHRDLKPANIKVKDDGTVKVLDFGLAKAFESEAEGDTSESPTMTAATGTGVILGTAAYMSPEQARGKRLDRRTDIFSFGSVLYEMLSGRRAFPGEDVSEILAAVIKTEPESSPLPSSLDPRLRQLLERCLRKDPRTRVRDIGDVRLEVEEIQSRPVEPTTTTEPPPKWNHALPWVLVGLSATVGVGAWLLREPERAISPAQMEISLPEGVVLAVDTEHPVLALSPDGTKLVFVGDKDGTRRLYLRELAAAESQAIAGTEGAASPFFSPDGEWVGFLAGQLIKKASISGGVPVAIHRTPGAAVNRGNSWITGDQLVQSGSANEGLVRASLVGDSLRSFDEWEWLTEQGHATAWPHALPTGDHVVFVDTSRSETGDTRIMSLRLGSRQSAVLFHGGTSPQYSNTGHLLFARDGALLAVPFDGARAEVGGTERRLLDGLMMSTSGAAQYSVSGAGTLAYVRGSAELGDKETVWVDREGLPQVVLHGEDFSEPRLSPEGSRVLMTSRIGSNVDIWMLDLSRSALSRVTSHSGEDLSALWSPIGSSIALASEIAQSPNNPGPTLVWARNLSSTPETLVETPGEGNWEFPTSWSPDGDFLLYNRVREASERDVWVYSFEDTKHRPLLDSDAEEFDAVFSPDGEWVAYVSDASGRDEVYAKPFSDANAATIPISINGGTEPMWSRDGRELFYRDGLKMMSVKVSVGAALVPDAPQLLFEGRYRSSFGDSSASYDVSLDGQRFLMVRTKDLVMPSVIHVVLNWPEALQ